MKTVTLKRLATVAAVVSFARKIDDKHIKRYHIGLGSLFIGPKLDPNWNPIAQVTKYLVEEFNEPIEVKIDPPLVRDNLSTKMAFETVPVDSIPYVSSRLKKLMRCPDAQNTIVTVPEGLNLWSKILIKVFGYFSYEIPRFFYYLGLKKLMRCPDAQNTIVTVPEGLNLWSKILIKVFGYFSYEIPRFFYYLGYRFYRRLYRCEYISISYLEKDEADAIRKVGLCLSASEWVLGPIYKFLFSPIIIEMADTFGIDQKIKMIATSPLFNYDEERKEDPILNTLFFTTEGGRGNWLYGKSPVDGIEFEDVWINEGDKIEVEVFTKKNQPKLN